jgi:hypothetical protein
MAGAGDQAVVDCDLDADPLVGQQLGESVADLPAIYSSGRRKTVSRSMRLTMPRSLRSGSTTGTRRGGNAALLRAGLVDEISVVIVPYLGGQSGRAAAACRQGR